MGVHVCVSRPEVDVGCVPQSLPTFLARQDSSVTPILIDSSSLARLFPDLLVSRVTRR